jgi:hypothetical protein
VRILALFNLIPWTVSRYERIRNQLVGKRFPPAVEKSFIGLCLYKQCCRSHHQADPTPRPPAFPMVVHDTWWRTHPPASRSSEHTTAGATSTNSLTPCSKRRAYFLESQNRNANVDKMQYQRESELAELKLENLKNWNLLKSNLSGAHCWWWGNHIFSDVPELA